MPSPRTSLTAKESRPRAPARTAMEAHYRLDRHDDQLEALATAQQQSVTATNSHIQAVSELKAAVADLKTCTTAIQDSLTKVVQDNESGRKTFETILATVLKDKAFTWVKLAIGSAVVSAPTWGPHVWKMFHG